MTVRMLSFFCNLIKVNLVKHEGLDIWLTKTNIKITQNGCLNLQKISFLYANFKQFVQETIVAFTRYFIQICIALKYIELKILLETGLFKTLMPQSPVCISPWRTCERSMWRMIGSLIIRNILVIKINSCGCSMQISHSPAPDHL